MDVTVVLFMFKISNGLETKLKRKSQWSDTDTVWIKVEFCVSLLWLLMIQMFTSFSCNCWNEQKKKLDPVTEGCSCLEGSQILYLFLLQCKVRPCLSSSWLLWNLFGVNNSWRAGSSYRMRPTIFLLFLLHNAHLTLHTECGIAQAFAWVLNFVCILTWVMLPFFFCRNTSNEILCVVPAHSEIALEQFRLRIETQINVYII